LAWYSWMFIDAPRYAARNCRRLFPLAEIGRDRLAGVDQRRQRLRRLVENAALRTIELNLDYTLNALGTNDRRHADVKVLDSVFTVEIGGAGQGAFLVLEIALNHGGGGGRRRIERRAGLEQVDDIGAAVAGALDDGVEARLRGPFH